MSKRIIDFGKLVMILGLAVCVITISTTVAFCTPQKTPIEVYNLDFQYPTEKINLTMWDYHDEFRDLQAVREKLCKEYEKIHPNVTIQYSRTPWGTYKTKYLAAFTARQGPDLCMWNPSLAPPGIAVPVPNWAIKIMEENYCELAIMRSQYQGEWYGPTSGELDTGQMLYYNEAMIEEAGLSGPPKTLPEFVEYGKKLTRYGSDGHIERGTWAIRYEGDKYSIFGKFQVFAWAFVDGRKFGVFNDDYTDIDLDRPEWIEALKFYKDMVRKLKIASVRMPKPNQAFMLELAVMTNREAFLWAAIEKQRPELLDDIRIGPAINGAPPYGKYEALASGTRAAIGEQWWVTRDSDYPQIARDVTMWLRGVMEHDLALAKAGACFPNWKENWETDYVKNLPYKDAAKVMMSRPAQKQELAPSEFNDAVWVMLGTAVADIITREDSNVEATWRDILEKCRQKIEKYWEGKGRKITFRKLRI